MNIQLRQLTSEELGIVRDLAHRIWPDAYQGLLPPGQIEYELNLRYAAGCLEQKQAAGWIFYGVFDGTLPAGYLAWSAADAPHDLAELHPFYLLPAYRGHGIGSLMLKETRRLARQAGFSRLRLSVDRDNAKAIQFYTRHGFRLVGTDNSPLGGGYCLKDLIMEASLT